MTNNEKEYKYLRIASIVLLFLFMILSITILAPHFSNPETYSKIIAYLDEKKLIATTFSASTAAVSTAITMLPSDYGNSIASVIADISGKFILVLGALYIEKYALTIIGLVVFKYVLPFACAILIAYLILGYKFLLELSLKLILASVLAVNIIPLGVKTSMLIEETYQESIIDINDKLDSDYQEIIDDTANNNTNNDKEYKPKSGSLLDNMQGAINYIATMFSDLVNSVNNTIDYASDYIKSIPERLKNALNNVLEATAVLLVTTCAVPIGVMFAFVALFNIIFSLNIDMKKNFSTLFKRK